MIPVVDALACYRLTRLVTTDRITAPLRDRVPFEVITCDWCIGQWVAFGVVAARKVAPKLWGPVALALAYSAVAGIVSENV